MLHSSTMTHRLPRLPSLEVRGEDRIRINLYIT